MVLVTYVFYKNYLVLQHGSTTHNNSLDNIDSNSLDNRVVDSVTDFNSGGV